ncbi:MAG: serine/threonine protein kinase, partial [Myxococcales bacterium]|nr:serine/threonine protein kinase [Myxococcales bacterium]
MSCPSDIELAELLQGLVADERREAIEDHLDECEDCRQLVVALVDTIAAPRRSSVDPDEPGDLDVGAKVGRYEITRRIGDGGMGRVLGAYDPQLDREVAIKVLHDRTLTDELRHRLRSEARALARLAHPNVVSVYGVERHRGRELVVMELVEGETLAAWQRRRPPWREVVAAYHQAGRGLAAAHARGLVHRDFKPGNCIRDPTGRVRVLDFGLARDLGDPSTDSHPMAHGDLALGSGDRPPPTRTGTILGTVAYMPLEQLRGGRVDARSDQWSFCASLFEAVAGERPFRLGRSLSEQDSILDSTRPTSRWPPGVPRSLWRIVERGLATSPEDRWSSLDRLLDEIERSVVPTRRWRLLSLGGLAAAVLAAWSWSTPPVPSCAPAAARLEGVWDGATRDRAHDGLVGTAVPYAEDTWRRLSPRLDDYAERWATADLRACERALSISSEPSPALEGRLACLEDRRRRLRALAQVLASADPTTVERAANAVSALLSIGSCDDVKPGDAPELAPQDPELASRLEALRQRLADADALTLAGRFDEALEQVRLLHGDVTALGYEPLDVEVELLWGRLSGEDGHYEDASSRLEDAFHRAVRAGREDVATDAALALIHVTGQELGEYDDAQGWARHARAHAERLEDDEQVAEVDLRLAG